MAINKGKIIPRETISNRVRRATKELEQNILCTCLSKPYTPYMLPKSIFTLYSRKNNLITWGCIVYNLKMCIYIYILHTLLTVSEKSPKKIETVNYTTSRLNVLSRFPPPPFHRYFPYFTSNSLKEFQCLCLKILF